MNRHQRRTALADRKKFPRQDIVFMRVNFDDLERAPEVVKLLHANYKTLNYPFGYGKVKYHSPEPADKGYYMVATVHLNHIDYMRKCAISEATVLHNVCAEWVKTYYPEHASEYMSMVKFYAEQRSIQKQRYLEKHG